VGGIFRTELLEKIRQLKDALTLKLGVYISQDIIDTHDQLVDYHHLRLLFFDVVLFSAEDSDDDSI
jgi:hypothetical protein